MKKRMLAILMAFTLMLGLPAMACADEVGPEEVDVYDVCGDDILTGNAFVAFSGLVPKTVDCDLYWVGDTLNTAGADIGAKHGGSALLAGKAISLKDSKIAGSLRVACQDLSLMGTKIGNNITAAAQTITCDDNTQARGLYAAASSLEVAGHYQTAMLAGESVTFSGKVDGDIQIDAKKVTITKDAVVGGTLIVPADAETSIPEDAAIGYIAKSNAFESDAPNTTSPLGIIPLLLFSCIAHIILLVVFFFLFRNALEQGVALTSRNLPSVIGSGVASFFLAPLLGILLLVPLVTAPVSVLIFACIALLWAFSIPLAGYILGRKVLPKLRPILAGIIGTTLLTLVCYLPFMFVLVPTLCSIFIAGCLVRQVYVSRKATPLSAPYGE